jgi:Sec-independent protein translocase protein (TatC)
MHEREIMTPLVLGLGVPELLIILAVVFAAVGWYAARRPGQEHRACPQGIQGRDQGPQVRRQPTAQPWTWGAYTDRNRLSAAAAGQAHRRSRPAAAPTSSRRGPTKIPPAPTCLTTPEAYSQSCHVFDDQGPADPLQLKWLKPPPVPPDGTMTLFEHLRELRYRLIVSALAIIVGMVVAWFFRYDLMDILQRPYFQAIAALKAQHPGAETLLVNINLTSPLTLALKVSALAG